jgi:hypothetical protein
MTKYSGFHAALLLALLMPCQVAFGLQESQATPLGDVARELRQKSAQQKKSAKRVHMVGSADAGAAPPNSAKPQAAETSATAESSTTQSEVEVVPEPTPVRTPEPDVIIVPAGTEIRVETLAVLPTVTRWGTVLYEGKVVLPVRLGFTTAIPALSKVKIAVNGAYSGAGYIVYGNSLFSPIGYADSSGYVSEAELDSITIDGTEYKVRTKAAPFSAISEQRFVLAEPLTLER